MVHRFVQYPKRDEVTGEWKRLHDEELYDLYSSPTIVCLDKAIPLQALTGPEGSK
jgi:hypothetical protein